MRARLMRSDWLVASQLNVCLIVSGQRDSVINSLNILHMLSQITNILVAYILTYLGLLRSLLDEGH